MLLPQACSATWSIQAWQGNKKTARNVKVEKNRAIVERQYEKSDESPQG